MQPALTIVKTPERLATQAATFPPLALETRSHIPTEQAAHYLSRRPQTLREWACTEAGPIRPLRLHGRLAWPVSEIRALLGLATA